LNKKQNIAFEIIARSYFKVLEAQAKNIPKADQPQLQMLMSGPGGVGKTYVVRAVQKVMELYGAAHKIKFTAPLGSCAALIKGSTLHNALKIQVKKQKKKVWTKKKKNIL
jgi:RecA-family ATPase